MMNGTVCPIAMRGDGQWVLGAGREVQWTPSEL